MHSLPTALLLLAAAATGAAAQGTLSTQGFGYPAGELSTRAEAMGGGPAETDALSVVNPASIGSWGRSGVSVEYAPEYRTVSADGRSDKTMTARFPLVQGTLTMGPRAVASLSGTSFLDRSWETARTGYNHLGADSVQYTEDFKSSGAISDLRLALSFAIARGLWLGVGGHLYNGDNRLTINRTTQDTTFTPFNQTARLSYAGRGVSGGVMWQPVQALLIGVSGEIGGTIKSFRNDTTLSQGKIPKRVGAGITYGLPGLVVSARAEWTGWSSLDPLANTARATDAWDVGAGIEARGPSVLGEPLPLRVGYRRRTLPFLVNDAAVRETTLSFGTGFPLARGASRVDVGVDRANRSGVAGVTEHAWTLRFGIMVRP